MRRNKKAKTAVVRKIIMERKFRSDDFSSKDYCCIHCGTPNPSHGDVCANCGENPYECKDLNPLKFNPNDLINFNPRALRQNKREKNNNPAW